MDYSHVIIVGAVVFSVLVVYVQKIVFLQADVVVCVGVLNGLGIAALLVVGRWCCNYSCSLSSSCWRCCPQYWLISNTCLEQHLVLNLL